MIPMEIIATIRSDFPTKFGIPRQSGLVTELKSTIVFEPAYRNPEMLRGIEGFSHLWLIWSFSKSGDHWSPTVRPPRLGGNQRMGGLRHPFALPTQQPGSVLGAPGAGGAAHAGGAGAPRVRGGFDGRHPHL